jgi:hypothetical protein
MKIIESDFFYRGYRCITTFTDLGHRCGYVGLSEGHPLYGKYNDSQVKVTMKELIEDEEMNQIGNRGVWTLLGLPNDEDDRVRLGSYFMIHGGITYADGGKDSHHPIDSDMWWLGFDCGHYGDCPDYDMLEELFGDDEKVKHRLEDRWLYEEYPVRDLKYVQQECKNLVDQIINLIEKYY